MEEDFSAVPPVSCPTHQRVRSEHTSGPAAAQPLPAGRPGRQVSSQEPGGDPVYDLMERLAELDRHLMAVLESAYRRAVGR